MKTFKVVANIIIIIGLLTYVAVTWTVRTKDQPQPEIKATTTPDLAEQIEQEKEQPTNTQPKTVYIKEQAPASQHIEINNGIQSEQGVTIYQNADTIDNNTTSSTDEPKEEEEPKPEVKRYPVQTIDQLTEAENIASEYGYNANAEYTSGKQQIVVTVNGAKISVNRSTGWQDVLRYQLMKL